jgi:hypothetical protein
VCIRETPWGKTWTPCNHSADIADQREKFARLTTLQPARMPHCNHGILPGLQCTQIFTAKTLDLKTYRSISTAWAGVKRLQTSQSSKHIFSLLFINNTKELLTYRPSHSTSPAPTFVGLYSLPIFSISRLQSSFHHVGMQTSSRE